MHLTVGILLALMSTGMAAFWILRTVSGGLQQGLRTLDRDNYIILHIVAELLTAVLCLAAGSAMIMQLAWGTYLGLVASGALGYSGINSLAWGLKNSPVLSLIFAAATAVAFISGIYLLGSIAAW